MSVEVSTIVQTTLFEVYIDTFKSKFGALVIVLAHGLDCYLWETGNGGFAVDRVVENSKKLISFLL